MTLYESAEGAPQVSRAKIVEILITRQCNDLEIVQRDFIDLAVHDPDLMTANIRLERTVALGHPTPVAFRLGQLGQEPAEKPVLHRVRIGGLAMEK